MPGIVPPAWSISEALDEGEQVEKLRKPFAAMTKARSPSAATFQAKANRFLGGRKRMSWPLMYAVIGGFIGGVFYQPGRALVRRLFRR